MSRRVHDFIDLQRSQELQQVGRIVIRALVWGPSATSRSRIARMRLGLRDELLARGHVASLSEDRYDPRDPVSLITQQAADAAGHDLILALPASPGSVAELHDFARMPQIAPKIVTFLNRKWKRGYANQSIRELSREHGFRVHEYDPAKGLISVLEPALREIGFTQELIYRRQGGPT